MRTLFVALMIGVFLVSSLGSVPARADELVLSKPGTMVHLSSAFQPAVLKGIKVHPDNPFKFDFILDVGDGSPVPNKGGETPPLRKESEKLIKYFLASLTIPEKDLWVNLSPYEKNRIVPDAFGQTEMGRDLLAQDYMLKQITASLIYPEDEIGKKFWKRVYEEAAKKFGTTNIPVNTFNKVWIVPEKAVVYENAKAGTAYVVESQLKVMLEQDYVALNKNSVGAGPCAGPTCLGRPQGAAPTNINQLGSQIVREIVIPALTKEINQGKNFVQLRQVYNSLIVATWYKKKIKDSILAQVYADRNKIKGVDLNSLPLTSVPLTVNKIFDKYLMAFKKGAYNYIKEEQDPITRQMMPRKYFSGGAVLDMAILVTVSKWLGWTNGRNLVEVNANLNPMGMDRRGFLRGSAAVGFGALTSNDSVAKDSKSPIKSQVKAPVIISRDYQTITTKHRWGSVNLDDVSKKVELGRKKIVEQLERIARGQISPSEADEIENRPVAYWSKYFKGVVDINFMLSELAFIYGYQYRVYPISTPYGAESAIKLINSPQERLEFFAAWEWQMLIQHHSGGMARTDRVHYRNEASVLKDIKAILGNTMEEPSRYVFDKSEPNPEFKKAMDQLLDRFVVRAFIAGGSQLAKVAAMMWQLQDTTKDSDQISQANLILHEVDILLESKGLWVSPAEMITMMSSMSWEPKKLPIYEAKILPVNLSSIYPGKSVSVLKVTSLLREHSGRGGEVGAVGKYLKVNSEGRHLREALKKYRPNFTSEEITHMVNQNTFIHELGHVLDALSLGDSINLIDSASEEMRTRSTFDWGKDLTDLNLDVPEKYRSTLNRAINMESLGILFEISFGPAPLEALLERAITVDENPKSKEQHNIASQLIINSLAGRSPSNNWVFPGALEAFVNKELRGLGEQELRSRAYQLMEDKIAGNSLRGTKNGGLVLGKVKTFFENMDWEAYKKFAGRDKAMLIFNLKEDHESDLDRLGGIDLTSDKALTVQNNGQSIKFNISARGGSVFGGDPAMLKQLKEASGFTPEITSMQPMEDLPKFLGVEGTLP